MYIYSCTVYNKNKNTKHHYVYVHYSKIKFKYTVNIIFQQLCKKCLGNYSTILKKIINLIME